MTSKRVQIADKQRSAKVFLTASRHIVYIRVTLVSGGAGGAVTFRFHIRGRWIDTNCVFIVNLGLDACLRASDETVIYSDQIYHLNISSYV